VELLRIHNRGGASSELVKGPNTSGAQHAAPLQFCAVDGSVDELNRVNYRRHLTLAG
jgi:hypothetical protein